jgi:PKD repeat protein
MKTGNFFQQLSQSSRAILILLAAVVVVWTVVIAMIIFGAVSYFQRPSVAQQTLSNTSVPTVSVDPTAAQVGTLLAISGKGWAPDSSISLYLLAPGQTQPPDFATAATIANAQGEFVTTLAVPSGSDWQTVGTATVIASSTGPLARTAYGNGPSARTTFALLSPQQAPTGTPTPTETLVPIPTLSPSPTLTPTPVPTVPTATSTITSNIRSGPGTNYPVEGVLLAGQSAEIVGASADGTWWEISSAGLPNGVGWIAASLVTAQDTQNVPIVEAPPVPTPATPVPTAQPPTAVVSGPSQAGQGQSITFSGSNSTASAGHTIATYAWNFGDGTTGNGDSVSHSYANAGSFVVSLTVTDDLGQTGTATLTIQITEQGPTANFDNPKYGNVGDVISFNGRESTAAAGHSITDYDWSFGDGSDASGSKVDHIFNRTGDFDVKLKVTDDQGLTSEVKHHIEISGPLLASISAPSQGQVGQSIAFSGSGIGTHIADFVWSFGDGSTASGQTVSHVYAGPGNFVVILTVTDEWEKTASATLSISISGQPLKPPTAVINAPSQGIKGQAVTFDGSGSSAGSGSITSYTWKFGDGATASGATVSHAFAKTGNHSVVLIVTNSSNLTAKATRIIKILSAAPVPPKAVISGPSTGKVGKSLSFSASSSSAGSGKITKYTWSFGDGHSGSGEKVSHDYTKTGTYTVTLTVTDGDKLTATTTHVVTIS